MDKNHPKNKDTRHLRKKLNDGLDLLYSKQKELVGILKEANDEERYKFYAEHFGVTLSLLRSFSEITEMLERIIGKPNKKILEKEMQEIEDIISIGIPGWVKYTKKTKKTKK